MAGIGFQRPVAQVMYNMGQGVAKAMPYVLGAGAIGTGAAIGAGAANMMNSGNVFGQPNSPEKLNDPYAAQRGQQYEAYKQGLDEVANQPGVLSGNDLIAAQQAQDNYLRGQRRLDRADQWDDMQKASYLRQNLLRDQEAQKFTQGMAELGFKTKADQAKDLLTNYAQGRRDAMSFAQNSFKSLV